MPTVPNVKPLSSEQKELIHRLVYFQDQYEAPSEKDMKRLTINNVPILIKKKNIFPFR